MESSLDRFARTRGAAMLGITAMGRSWKIQTAVGSILLSGAAILGIVAVAVGPPEIAFGVMGPAIAGFINLGFGLTFRKQALRHGRQTDLSPAARALLHALVVRAQVWQGGFRRHGPGMHGRGGGIGFVAAAEPPRAAMEALERAAAAHNRVSDVLGEAHDERSLRLRAAADAGMGEVLEQAARMTTDDIGGIGRMEDTINRLVELADRTEASLGRPEGASGLRSTLDATLEELRAEDEARQELRG